MKKKKPAFCTQRCIKCKYAKRLNSGAFSVINIYCDYLCMEKSRRPCPAGDKCTVYERRKRGKKNDSIENDF